MGQSGGSSSAAAKATVPAILRRRRFFPAAVGVGDENGRVVRVMSFELGLLFWLLGGRGGLGLLIGGIYKLLRK